MAGKITRKELIELVEKLLSNEGTEEQDTEWMNIIERNVPDPEVIDLIYRTELSPAEIVDRALACQPILLARSSLESTDE